MDTKLRPAGQIGDDLNMAARDLASVVDAMLQSGTLTPEAVARAIGPYREARRAYLAD